jgi:hypothetical protein
LLYSVFIIHIYRYIATGSEPFGELEVEHIAQAAVKAGACTLPPKKNIKKSQKKSVDHIAQAAVKAGVCYPPKKNFKGKKKEKRESTSLKRPSWPVCVPPKRKKLKGGGEREIDVSKSSVCTPPRKTKESKNKRIKKS